MLSVITTRTTTTSTTTIFSNNFENRKKFYIKLLHLIFLTLCTLGLTWQVYEVSNEYFVYDTNTRIKIQYPYEIEIPSLTLCLRYTDVLNITKANIQLKNNWTNENGEYFIRKIQNEITTKEIFDYTPGKYEIIDHLYFRDSTGYSNGSCDDITTCKSILKVNKFIYIEYICYTFHLENSIKVKPKVISVHPICSGVLANYSFSNIFQNVSHFKLSLHTRLTEPFNSLMIQPISYRKMSPKSGMFNSVFYSSPNFFNIQYMKPPYITMCYDYEIENRYQSQFHCIQICVRNKIRYEFNKEPYSVFTQSANNRKIISTKDLLNVTVSERLYAIEEECEKSKECKFRTCNMRTAITLILPQPGNKSDFEVIINTPQQPWIDVQHEEALSLIRFITFLMGIFSTWTGVGLFALSPFKRFISTKKSSIASSKKVTSTNAKATQEGPTTAWTAATYGFE